MKDNWVQNAGECLLCGHDRPESDLIEVMELNSTEPVKVCTHCYENEVNAPGWGWSNDFADTADYEFRKPMEDEVEDDNYDKAWYLRVKEV